MATEFCNIPIRKPLIRKNEVMINHECSMLITHRHTSIKWVLSLLQVLVMDAWKTMIYCGERMPQGQNMVFTITETWHLTITNASIGNQHCFQLKYNSHVNSLTLFTHQWNKQSFVQVMACHLWLVPYYRIEAETKLVPFFLTVLDAFLMKMYEFHLGFHWSLFLRDGWKIFQYWFR